MGPSRSYLEYNENIKETRGTEFHKHKMRVTTVMCVNSDGSDVLTVYCIGKSERSICLRDSRYSSLSSQYWSGSNGCMDTNGFNRCINIWYSHVKKISSGPWCRLMDNCGGHELNFNLDGVSIIYMPLNSTSKHQPLDLDLITASKTRYRTALLDATLETLQRYQVSESAFKINSGRGKWG